MTKIPLVDLALQHAQVADEVAAGWAAVVERSAYILGAEVERFENDFSSFMGVRHCVGVANGTDALEMTLRGLGIGPGDEVIVPANSFIASALGVFRAGARPVLVDCDPATYLLDPKEVEARLTPRVRAVMPVHLFGQAAPVELLAGVAGDLPIIEDGAQAQGATRWGKPVGSLGTVAATSFYPGKNIGAYGDGGAVLTDSDEMATRVRALRNWGSDRKYHHPVIGFNSRLDTLQAVVLTAKLRHLADWNRQRGEAANHYLELLSPLEPVVPPSVLEGNQHVWHLFVVRVPNRDNVMAKMRAAGVEVGVHYPIPMHLQGALAELGYHRGEFPATEAAATEMLSLPMFPGITLDEQERVVATLAAALGS